MTTLSSLIAKGCCITGTGTEVGKTTFAARLLKACSGTYWKPIQTGRERDRDYVQKITGLDDAHFLPEVYHLRDPLSPHEAALRENKLISLSSFEHPSSILYPPLIVEGAGGVLVPLNDKEFMVDLFVKLELPVIVVALSTLGTINHTLLSLSCLRDKNVDILGVVTFGPRHPENEQAIERYGKVPILDHVPLSRR